MIEQLAAGTVVLSRNMGLDVQDGGAVQHVDPFDAKGVSFSFEYRDDGQANPVGSHRGADGKNPHGLGAVGRCLQEALLGEAGTSIEMEENHDLLSWVDVLESLGIFLIEDQGAFEFGNRPVSWYPGFGGVNHANGSLCYLHIFHPFVWIENGYYTLDRPCRGRKKLNIAICNSISSNIMQKAILSISKF